MIPNSVHTAYLAKSRRKCSATRQPTYKHKPKLNGARSSIHYHRKETKSCGCRNDFEQRCYTIPNEDNRNYKTDTLYGESTRKYVYIYIYIYIYIQLMRFTVILVWLVRS